MKFVKMMGHNSIFNNSQAIAELFYSMRIIFYATFNFNLKATRNIFSEINSLFLVTQTGYDSLKTFPIFLVDLGQGFMPLAVYCSLG